MYNPTTRLLTILELLQTYSVISGNELARRLEVEPRSVRRYITMLQDIGMPIEAAHGPGGGYSLRAGFKLPPLMFTEEEATAVALGLVASTWLDAGQDAAAIQGALAKLARVLPLKVREKIQAIAAHTEVIVHNPPPTPDASLLLDLTGAVHDSRRIFIEYQSFNRESSHRKIDPYGVGGFQGRWYLIGYCWLRRDYRTFRLDRISRLQVLAEPFEKDPAFDYKEYMRGKENEGGIMMEVLFRADLEIVREKIPVRYGRLIPTDEGVILQDHNDSIESMARYAANFILPFEVIRPPELVRELHRLGERLLQTVSKD